MKAPERLYLGIQYYNNSGWVYNIIGNIISRGVYYIAAVYNNIIYYNAGLSKIARNVL